MHIFSYVQIKIDAIASFLIDCSCFSLIMNEKQDEYLNEGYYLLRKRLGEFLRAERKSLGYKNALELAMELGMSDTQLRSYERGEEDMQLSTLYKLLMGLGRIPEDIFTPLVLQGVSDENLPPNVLSSVKEHQLRQQVKAKLGAKVADALSSEEVYRLHEMVRLASRREVRKSEIRDSLGLKTYTRAFNRLLDIARQAGLLRLKYPDSLHHKGQRYLG